MVVQRGLKILLVGGLAFLCALTTWGNLRDPATNYTFVRHVVSMDTISPDAVMASNAIQIPLVWSIAFWAIVAAEGLTTALFAWGTVELFQARKFKARVFDQAKRFVFAGAGCGFLIWFVGFLAVGAEWFAMWQSRDWNGQQDAFRIFASILLVMSFVAQPEAEL